MSNILRNSSQARKKPHTHTHTHTHCHTASFYTFQRPTIIFFAAKQEPYPNAYLLTKKIEAKMSGECASRQIQDRTSYGSRQTNEREDSELGPNDSPDIPGRGETLDIPGLSSGDTTVISVMMIMSILSALCWDTPHDRRRSLEAWCHLMCELIPSQLTTFSVKNSVKNNNNNVSCNCTNENYD